MPSFSNLSIRAKVLLAFGIVLITAIGLGGFAIDRLGTVNGSAAEIRDNWLPATGWLGTISKATEQYRARQGQFLLAAAQDRIHLERQMSETLELFDNTWRLYEPTVTTTEERALVAAFRTPWTTYLDHSKQLLELARKNQSEAATTLYLSSMSRDFGAARKALEQDLAWNVDQGKK